MKSILAIIYCFPPILVPATIRYLKWFKGLRQLGYRIDALSINPDSFSAPGQGMMDASLAKLVPKGINHHTVWSWENNMLVKVLKRTMLGYHILYRFFEPRKMEWYFPVKKYLRSLDLSSFDVLLTCSKPDSSHVIGLYLKHTTGKPWVAYFSDPWVDSFYATFPSRMIAAYNASLEMKVVTNADAIVFTNQATLNLVSNKYPPQFREKMYVLPHSFVPEWYDLAKDHKSKPHNSNKTTVVHTGHFYGPRTPMPLFRALLRLKERKKDISDTIRFIFYGNMDHKHDTFLAENRLTDLVRINSTIPYLQSLGAIKSANYLLLIDAPLANTSESVFLPSKLIDYIGSYNSVIGITPAKGASASVLRETGNAVCDIDDPHAIFRTITNIAEGTIVLRPKRQRINRYHYKRITKELSDIIEQCSG